MHTLFKMRVPNFTLVSWKVISRSKMKGGLGIGNLRCKNKALLLKWLWRFPNEQDALWAKIIKSKFGLHENKWDSCLARRSTSRSPWKFISSLYEDYGHMVSFKVGNGRRIRFWEDVWWGEEAFYVRFPNLYRLSLAQNCNIAELFIHQSGTSFHGWDLRFYRHLNTREILQFAVLSEILDQVHLNGECEDIRIWNHDRSGGFSCKSAAIVLHHDIGVHDFQFYRFIWKATIPVRIRFFAWSLSLEKIYIRCPPTKTTIYVSTS